MATIGKEGIKIMATIGKATIKPYKVVLAGKEYYDLHKIGKPCVSAYIQCSWFNPKQIKFMEEGLKAIAANPTVSLANSHHPLSHQYNDINVEEHPEVMDDFEWQTCTYKMDESAMDSHELGIALYLPSDPDEGIAYECGYLKASHKPNIVVIPDDETTTPINLMMIGNTQIIKMSELANFDFNNIIYKPYKGKVF